VRTSLKYHFEARETDNFFKPVADEKLLKHFACSRVFDHAVSWKWRLHLHASLHEYTSKWLCFNENVDRGSDPVAFNFRLSRPNVLGYLQKPLKATR